MEDVVYVSGLNGRALSMMMVLKNPILIWRV